MIERSGDFVPYSVSFSGRVLEQLQVLAGRAKDKGMAADFIAALAALEHRLRVYPQFGQPLRDVATESGQEWIGVVPPLVVNYVLYHERREVTVVRPIRTLPKSGL
ncbi:MAG TPA: hypothetical protein VH120_00930 [Gemmataceae bacterium]|jgi:hypothetical protein|nr:hypothetical protein [Gemmataceae bacterium]